MDNLVLIFISEAPSSFFLLKNVQKRTFRALWKEFGWAKKFDFFRPTLHCFEDKTGVLS